MDKYPSISPYAYCSWNPMKYVDPDGKDAIQITFPQYKANGIPHTGHAGVLLINNQNGLTKYYEYGRYDKEKLGITRNLKIPDVKLKDGKPTPESLNKVLRSISKQAGHNGNIEGAYVKSDNFTKMDSYAKDKIQENNDPQRKPYNIITNVICYESIKKTTPGSKIHNLIYSLLVLSSVSTLYQCINSIKEINNIKELQKYRLFLEHEDLINELNKTGINLTINDLDNYSYNSLSEIINRFGQNKEYTKKKI